MKTTTTTTEANTVSLTDLYTRSADLFNDLIDLTDKKALFAELSRDLRTTITDLKEQNSSDYGYITIGKEQNIHLDALFLSDKGSLKDKASKRQAYKAAIQAGRVLGRHGDRANKLLAFLRERSLVLKTPIYNFTDAQFEALKATHQKALLKEKLESDKIKKEIERVKAEQDKINTERSLISPEEAYEEAYERRAELIALHTPAPAGTPPAPAGTPPAPAGTNKISFKAGFSPDVMAEAKTACVNLVDIYGIPTSVAIARMILAKYESAD